MEGTNHGHRDITRMLTAISEHVKLGNQQVSFERKRQAKVERTVLARILILLMMMICENIKTPEEWLLVQLNGLYQDLDTVHSYLRDTYSVDTLKGLEDLHNLLEKSLALMKTITGQRFVCFVDETNILLRLYEGIFNRTNLQGYLHRPLKSTRNNPLMKCKMSEPKMRSIVVMISWNT